MTPPSTSFFTDEKDGTVRQHNEKKPAGTNTEQTNKVSGKLVETTSPNLAQQNEGNSGRATQPRKKASPLASKKNAKKTAPDETEEERVREIMYQSIIGLIISASILTLLGLLMVYSALTPGAVRSQYTGTGHTFRTAYMQIAYAGIGIIGAWIATRINFRFFEKWAWYLYWAAIALQLLVLSPLGVSVAGNRNWVGYGAIRIQPSEFLKLAMILVLATTMAKLPTVTRKNFEFSEWKNVFISVGGALVAVMAGFDMGTAMIFSLIAIGMIWLAGFPRRWLFLVAVFGALVAAIFVASSTSRLARVTDFFENIFYLPNDFDPSQSDFALWAFGSGGLGGSGLGTGVEKWPGNLAEAHTDFIFAVVGEELGFFGCIVIIAMFVLMAWSLLRMCIFHPHKVARFFMAGALLWLCGQGLINMLVVTSMLPVFGVPLPLMSQGGSSVISCLATVGICISAARDVPGVKESFKRSGSLVKRARAVIRRNP